MKRSKIKPFSDKRLAQLAKDIEVLKVLCKQAGGAWMPGATYNGVIIGIHCHGGKCEECRGKATAPDFMLHPHEIKFKSAGGRVSFDNSVMLCDTCHKKAHGINVVGV